MTLRVPYSQQFSPGQTPLRRLLPILRQHKSDIAGLRTAIASAFFATTKAPPKIAANTIITLKGYKIINETGGILPFGQSLLDCQKDLNEAHRLLAKHLILELGGLVIVETLREMASAQERADLVSLQRELEKRGVETSSNSSDLSSVMNWLREAGVLSGYEVNELTYAEIVGVSLGVVGALKGLPPEQVMFLRAMVALNIADWFPYNKIIDHAEALYSGEIGFNRKDIVDEVLSPLEAADLIEIRKKSSRESTGGRGGKPAEVRPKHRFESEVADPLLRTLYASAGFAQVREIRSKSLQNLVTTIESDPDQNARAKALEWLAIRICQMIDLSFHSWRVTDEGFAAGGEVDALFHSARLIYSRWQIQCKVGNINLEAVAKEVGMKDVTLANVILIVGTERATEAARMFRRRIVGTSNLNIILIDGPLLKRVVTDPSTLVSIFKAQAEGALRWKSSSIQEGGGSDTGGSGTEPALGRKKSIKTGTGEQIKLNLAYTTKFGKAYLGDSLGLLSKLIDEGVRAKLIVTSPPFALIRKKDYGNEDADGYLRWFSDFIPLFRNILEPTGSIVIDIGGAWIKGIPARSTYQYKALIALCESGFYLAQDFYHYNPARLPTPAEWVTIRRLRVKDAINNVWWLVLDPFVPADNRKVLKPYSASMLNLIKNGYTPKLRPSGHDISHKFQKNNNGAIPPNLLEFANTESNSHYLRRCKAMGMRAHPARFPQALPEFFINFLTDPGDLIIDPFAGSNVSGAAAEKLGRRWLSCELDFSYVLTSRFRFEAAEDYSLSEAFDREPHLAVVATENPVARAPGGPEINIADH